MDGLDVYIDDYSSPEKLPESTLRQMVSARVLALVQDDPLRGPAMIPPARPGPRTRPRPVMTPGDPC